MTQQEDIKRAIETLRNGGVILYPTDTVWGIGCDATNPEAVKKVYEIKHRDDSKALICLVDSDARLQRYVRNVPDVAWDIFELATKPTTIILDDAVNLAPNLIAKDGTIAMRITREPFSKELCYRFQKPLVSTSANISGEPAAQNYCDISEELLNAVDYVCISLMMKCRTNAATEAKKPIAKARIMVICRSVICFSRHINNLLSNCCCHAFPSVLFGVSIIVAACSISFFSILLFAYNGYSAILL